MSAERPKANTEIKHSQMEWGIFKNIQCSVKVGPHSRISIERFFILGIKIKSQEPLSLAVEMLSAVLIDWTTVR